MSRFWLKIFLSSISLQVPLMFVIILGPTFGVNNVTFAKRLSDLYQICHLVFELRNE